MSAYTLSHKLVAAHAGGPVVCLDERGIGRAYPLSRTRLDSSFNERISAAAIRSEVIGTTGGTLDVYEADLDPSVTIVTVRGALEQRATMHSECGGWTDGHDAIAERMCAALVEGDVALVIDSPGGAHAGLQEAIRRVQKCKADYGRRITAYADEMIGSAAYWWAATVADEIYLPEAGIVGSIGARSSHCSEAGHLAQEGVEVTYFAAPGAGKVAFAPELPLSEIGKQRGERDVWIAFEAFASAVSGSRGLSREDLIKLDADALTGQMAVDAGLADGVASFDDVLAYALAMAGGEGVATSDEEAAPTGNNASGVVAARRLTMAGQPESPEQVKKLDEQARKMAEKKMLESLAAKYADELAEKHAEKMAEAEDEESDENSDADADSDSDGGDGGGDGGGGDGGGGGGDDADMAEVEDEADEDEEEAPPSSKKAMPPPKRMQPPPAKQDRSVAALFGLHASASAPAVKAAALPYVSLAKAALSVTGARTVREAEGALRALADDAADAVKLRAEVKAVKAREARRERMDLLRKLASANLPGYARGDLFVDVELNGKLVPVPAPMYDEMKLGTLRGLVAAKLKGAPSTQAAPFQPSQTAAVQAANQATVDVVAPQATQFSGRSTASTDKLAAAAAALMQMGAFSNG